MPPPTAPAPSVVAAIAAAGLVATAEPGDHRSGERGGRRGIAREFAEPRQQIVADLLPCARQALAHGGVGDAQQGRDLLRALAFAIEQQQGFAAVLGQGGDQLGRRHLAFAIEHVLHGLRAGIGGDRQHEFGIGAVQRLVAVATQVVAGQVARDLAQPGQEAVGAVQTVQPLPGVEEASWAMSSLAPTSRVIASATAVTVFWHAETIRP